MRESPVCGGTTRSRDSNAPKSIMSDKMTFFHIESSFKSFVNSGMNEKNSWILFISLYAVPVECGSFLLLNAENRYEEKRDFRWSLIKKDVFPELVKAVNEAGLAENNGSHSFTHGLPENFGGEVKARYEGGEYIDYANNQSPVISKAFGLSLYDMFSGWMDTERADIPGAENIISVMFCEEYEDGYSRAELKRDGSGYSLKKENKFEAPEVYTSTESVPAGVMNTIKNIVEKNAVLLWNNFPESGFKKLTKKSLTFTLDDGSEITVFDDRELPKQFSSAFFNIELEMIIKNHKTKGD